MRKQKLPWAWSQLPREIQLLRIKCYFAQLFVRTEGRHSGACMGALHMRDSQVCAWDVLNWRLVG